MDAVQEGPDDLGLEGDGDALHLRAATRAFHDVNVEYPKQQCPPRDPTSPSPGSVALFLASDRVTAGVIALVFRRLGNPKAAQLGVGASTPK